MDAAALAFRFALAILFALAGFAKLKRRRQFENAVRGYQLLPRRFVRPFAITIPIAELAAGVFLAAGLAITIVSIILAALLVLFSIGISINLLRGRDIDCGCFGGATPRRITWRTVLRNVGLATAAVAVAFAAPAALSVDSLLAEEYGARAVSNGDAVAILVITVMSLYALGITSTALQVRRALSTLRPSQR